ncbi:hypothetical protein PS15p_200824 [Mucor circinelloides]
MFSLQVFTQRIQAEACPSTTQISDKSRNSESGSKPYWKHQYWVSQSSERLEMALASYSALFHMNAIRANQNWMTQPMVTPITELLSEQHPSFEKRYTL